MDDDHPTVDAGTPGCPAPPARSPIRPGATQRTSAESAAVTLMDCAPMTKILVCAGHDSRVDRSLAIRLGRAVRRTIPGAPGPALPGLIAHVAPEEWLVLGPVGSAAALLAWLEDTVAASDDVASVIDLTHSSTLLRLTGDAAPTVLAAECAVDLTPDECHDGAALRTAVAGVATAVVRDDMSHATAPSYLLFCEWSTGQYLVDSLLDTGTDISVGQTTFNPAACEGVAE